MGVLGYRIDARLAGDAKWHSLCRAKGPVKLDRVDLGTFDGELGVLHVREFAAVTFALGRTTNDVGVQLLRRLDVVNIDDLVAAVAIQIDGQ